MRRFWSLFKQDTAHLITSPVSLGCFLVFPSILILLMGFLFDNLYNVSLISSYDFYGVTMIFFIIMIGSTIPASLFLSKRYKSGNTRIFYSPVPRGYIYLSKIIACFLFMAICISINVIVFQLIGFVNFGGTDIFYILFLLINFILFLTVLSSAICVSIRSEEYTNVILSNSMSVLGLLSGIFFPISSLGPFFEKVASYSPIKWTVDCMFQWIYDGECQHYWWIMLGLFLMSIGLLLIVHRNYSPKDYL